MKRFFALFLILLFCFPCLCACDFNKHKNDFSSDISIEQETTEQHEKEVEYSNDTGDYKDIWYYEDAISYYEKLCDEYGYQTYEGVYYPELWKFYVDAELDVYHNDWLCQHFNHNHNYFCTTQVGSFEKYTPCSSCIGVETVFLDEEEGVYHSDKKNLELRTEDFISVNVNYRLVSEENAIQNGYRQCGCCN